MKSLRVSIFLAAALSIGLLAGGCASINQAGMASYTVKPAMIDGKPVCCEATVHNGKQYASLDVVLIKQGDDYTVLLSERDVEAFRGQEIAAGATRALASTAAKAAAAAVLAPALPAAGAALASPGIGAAALGAGALAVGQELAK